MICAFGAGLLPDSVIPYLGLLTAATVTFFNGCDNIGVFLPDFATTDRKYPRPLIGYLLH